ncbi:KilA-N domain-containing protein [Paraburkholderia sp. EG287A]|uniref:KilA-N domain-containing protein n=1 Tax=Paraburkholderia sp. EG287A TaxID=3237012 RepID=UPI0034D359D1
MARYPEGLRLRGSKSKSYLAAFERKYGKIPYLKMERGQHGGGTWTHPEIAVLFARWVSKPFGTWCDKQIKSITHCEAVVVCQ